MKKKITTKVDNYLTEFKNDIKEYFQNNSVSLVDNTNDDKLSDFLRYVYDYKCIEFDENDFQKRKRIKNKVPDCNRCCALKANGERCSRKVKDEGKGHYCGTHLKGVPYGSILDSNSHDANIKKEKKVEVWIQEVNGIDWYIDKDLNVYDVNDIKNGSSNPRIIHKLKMNSNMQYEFCN